MEVTSQQRVSTRTVEADSTTSPRSSQTIQSKNCINNVDFVQSKPLQKSVKCFKITTVIFPGAPQSQQGARDATKLVPSGMGGEADTTTDESTTDY